jgi:hypothetical protein
MTAASVKKITERVTLSSLANEIIDDCGDVDITARRMVNKLRADPALFARARAANV